MGSQAEQRVGIVTGASSGMGLALTRHFIGKGWKIAMFDINDKVGNELVQELGPATSFHKVDVASYDSQAAGFLSVFEQHGRIDALLANAGIVDRSSLYILGHRANQVEDIPPAPDTLCTDVDFKGVLYGTQLAVHFMRHNPPALGGGAGEAAGNDQVKGRIVCTASVAGIVPHPSYPEYNGAKAGVVTFIRGVAGVLKVKEQIHINCVCPGIVATSIIPPEMVAAVQPEYMTAVDTVVRGYEEFLDEKDQRFGVVVEASVDEVLEVSEGRLANGKASEPAVTVWDPLFKMLHGEGSGLKNAIP
ncbi:uncharacterized protein B0I36DRAFT_382577 [Microdochium trichocladiopsis]|uniref:15-hydroxyprostaglandin dehydrogenase n=1 Tax=Microdochium trichocladiopsis TaxID=1682393 RepID=A0A9P8YCX9_9PEZI|nr:uncharacterized protein B0I36DRAFT_382577 [Microdochium trichocladiopsis]KAH7035977.1 hypothetical protein B0I36DRAFT_382577 [Microdochium trichocladiopsis]